MALMIQTLTHPVFRRLYSAQVLALLGTGLMTVALAVLAFDLAGANAGAVLGTALMIKMVAYVGFSPIAHAITQSLPRKLVLVAADVVRILIALSLPFVSSVWQIYVCIFVLQLASATFTPAFQALIPEVFRDEKSYTQALSLSRLAYEFENIASPALAGLLLGFVSFHWLFAGTAVGFAISAILIARTVLPKMTPVKRADGFVARTTRGARIYLKTPRLRGLLAFTLGVAAPAAFVFVNTIIVVRVTYDRPESALVWATGAFGLGAIIAAFLLPALLERIKDRVVMLGGAILTAALSAVSGGLFTLGIKPDWTMILVIWAVLGFGYSTVLTPTGRLLRRSAKQEDRAAIFAAHFALSHAAWLITYPLAGYLGVMIGLGPTLVALSALSVLAIWAALALWPAPIELEPVHSHDDLDANDPHLLEHGTAPHRHPYYIDDNHPYWPRQN